VNIEAFLNSVVKRFPGCDWQDMKQVGRVAAWRIHARSDRALMNYVFGKLSNEARRQRKNKRRERNGLGF